MSADTPGDAFFQCPHEVIRATCGGCNCVCDSCQRINAALADTPPGGAA